ncbi:TPA: hypothetical protein R6B73_001005 [Campylobacter jejuni]|nr:hypothetical protein [Campylobacter jejuni]
MAYKMITLSSFNRYFGNNPLQTLTKIRDENTTDTKINKLFFNTTENLMIGNSATDIFNNNNDGEENINTGQIH